MTASDSDSNIQQDPDLLAVSETESYRLTLRFAREQMECIATIELTSLESPPSSESAQAVGATLLNPSGLMALLRQHNITDTTDKAAVNSFCSSLDLGQVPPPTVVACGIEPQPGTDGWFELLVKVSGEDHEFVPDEKGRIDLKRLNAYTEIESEQKLGVIHPPEPGISGCTVQGHIVAAPAGKPRNIIAGEGVLFKYNGRIAFSTCSGRAIIEKDRLSVVDQLVIPGNVDVSIGDIDFNGFVEIKGDVPDDFDVRSTKGIKIGGHVGACHIESRGSIDIGAMAGREIGHIFCQGNLRAKYLNQVTVLCYGDVDIASEIRYSRIKATGHVQVERGFIIGGEVVALKGISAATIGAEAANRTLITAGVYFPDAERFAYLEKELITNKLQIKSISAAIQPLVQHLRKDSPYLKSARVRLQVLNDQLDRLYLQKTAFQAELAASMPQCPAGMNPKINVYKRLKEGVVVSLGGTREQISMDRTGPFSLIENTREGGLRYLSLTSLPVTAMEIEDQLLQAEEQNSEDS